MKNGQVDRAQNSSPSLLSNVSFDPELEDGFAEPPKQNKDTGSNRSSAREPATDDAAMHSTRRQQREEGRRSQNATMSSSYQKLLDRSSDLESPLKQFAQKHGFKLNDAKESPAIDGTKSPSPTDLSISELTKVTPRTDSNLSPRQKPFPVSGNETVCAQSYTVSTAVDEQSAKAAGIPVITDGGSGDMADSCSEITFSSLTDDKADTDSPVLPIPLAADVNGTSDLQQMGTTRSSTTSFVDMGKSKLELESLSLDTSMISPAAPNLKQQYEQRQSAEGKLEIIDRLRSSVSLNSCELTDDDSCCTSLPYVCCRLASAGNLTSAILTSYYAHCEHTAWLTAFSVC